VYMYVIAVCCVVSVMHEYAGVLMPVF